MKSCPAENFKTLDMIKSNVSNSFSQTMYSTDSDSHNVSATQGWKNDEIIVRHSCPLGNQKHSPNVGCPALTLLSLTLGELVPIHHVAAGVVTVAPSTHQKK